MSFIQLSCRIQWRFLIHHYKNNIFKIFHTHKINNLNYRYFSIKNIRNNTNNDRNNGKNNDRNNDKNNDDRNNNNRNNSLIFENLIYPYISFSNKYLYLNPFLKKGTLLYQGFTINDNLNNDTNNNLKKNYYSLEMTLPLWNILEEIYVYNDPKYKKVANIQGFLYVYEIVNDLPITKINPSIETNTRERFYKNFLTHHIHLYPQIAYHGVSVETSMRSVEPLFDLCTEININYSKYKNYLTLKQIYNVNPHCLHSNISNPKFDPRISIIPNPIFTKPISRQTYLLLFDSKFYTQQDFVDKFL